MQIIDPTYITDSTLISCDIPASTAGVPEWDDTYSYITGQRVSVNYEDDGVTPGCHKIYECTWHGTGNVNLYPPDNLGLISGKYWWSRVSATERWKLFDMIVAPDRANASDNVIGCDWEADCIWEPGTVWDSSTYSHMQVTVQPGEIDTVAVMNADCETISIIMTDPVGGEVYNTTNTASTSTYFNGVYDGLSSYPNATVTVLIRNYSADINVGEIIFGSAKTLGNVRYGVGVSLVDYSAKQTDAFGTFSILERAFSKRLDCTIIMTTANHSGIMRLLEKYRTTPLVWIVSDLYSTTLIYGYYRDFKIEIKGPTVAECAISIEGLGGDLVYDTPIPDPWVDPWDGIIDLVVPDIPTVAVPVLTKIEEALVAILPADLDTLEVPAVPTVTHSCQVFNLIGTCTISHAEPGVVTCNTHGLLEDCEVLFSTTGALPLPLVAGTHYWVMYDDANSFRLSLTIAGSQIDTTTDGSGVHSLLASFKLKSLDASHAVTSDNVVLTQAHELAVADAALTTVASEPAVAEDP